MQCCGTSFLAMTQAATQRMMPCNATVFHFVAVAQRALLWHKELYHSTKSFSVAQRALPWHKECGTKSFTLAQRALPQHKERCCSAKKWLQHEEHCCGMEYNAMAQKNHCSMECDATALRIWPQHQHQTSAPPGWLFFYLGIWIFSPKLFWFAVEGSGCRSLQVTTTPFP